VFVTRRKCMARAIGLGSLFFKPTILKDVTSGYEKQFDIKAPRR